MAIQIVGVNDAAPGATVDVGMTWNGSDTITTTQALSGTSLTLSSTITGGAATDIALNTDKFTVDATNGNTVIAGTLTQTGAVAAAASITLGAGADLIGSSTSDITINTNKFTVAGASGNTVIAGTCAITGAVTLTGAVGAASSITLGAGADLIGSSTSDITINTNKFTVAGASGNTVIAGTVAAGGTITLGAGADLVGSSTSDITINTDKFTVAGATGNTAVGGTLTTTGVVTCNEAVCLGGTVNAAAHGAQVVPIDTLYDSYVTDATSAIAASLADGSAVGQMKVVVLDTKDTNNMVLTPDHMNNGTTITFDATGEYAMMVFDGTSWTVVSTNATVA